MVRKHTIKKETTFNADTGNISIKEEHVIIEKHNFLKDEGEDDETDMYFLGAKKKETVSEEIDEPTLYVFNDDDKFW